MPLAGFSSLALSSLQAGQESVNNLQALSDTGCRPRPPSTRSRLLFATVPSKKGEAAEECSCV